MAISTSIKYFQVVFTCFNKDNYEESLERLDYVFVKYIYKVSCDWSVVTILTSDWSRGLVLWPGEL